MPHGVHHAQPRGGLGPGLFGQSHWCDRDEPDAQVGVCGGPVGDHDGLDGHVEVVPESKC